MTGTDWPRSSTPDPGPVVRGIAARAGILFEVLGRCAGGEVGAHLIRGPDQRVSVLKWVDGLGRGEELRARRDLLDRLRARGVPAPRYELVVELPDGVAVVQERLAGESPPSLTHALLDELLAVNELLAGAGDPGASPVPLYLVDDGAGFCLHGPLRATGGRAARLLEAVESIGHEIDEARLPVTDAVHLDFHPGNALVDPSSGHSLSGIVDWEAVRAGDRRFDLVTLWFACIAYDPAPGVDERLAEIVEREVEPGARAAYLAHMALRQVDWSIRHHDDARIELALDRCDALLATVLSR